MRFDYISNEARYEIVGGIGRILMLPAIYIRGSGYGIGQGEIRSTILNEPTDMNRPELK